MTQHNTLNCKDRGYHEYILRDDEFPMGDEGTNVEDII